jgi:hypothetical protein
MSSIPLREPSLETYHDTLKSLVQRSLRSGLEKPGTEKGIPQQFRLITFTSIALFLPDGLYEFTGTLSSILLVLLRYIHVNLILGTRI